MKILGVIPARYASTRFPGKPLAIINGVSMIERVYKQATLANSLSDVVVATDDSRIFDHVHQFGGKVVMTSANHPSGTDRCAEVVQKMSGDLDAVINIQGDEPYIHPEQIDLVASCVLLEECNIATLVKVIDSESDLQNPNIPKVVVGADGRALYFSRRPIPYFPEDKITGALANGSFLRHIGIYGYRSDTLLQLAKLAPAPLELAEYLEQLRWLSNGYSIHVKTTAAENHAVDAPADVAKLERLFGG
ncbi:MAG: 3-deoxy-manno-octulosonate cytidylyltransferase [Bacteroidota bacterium]